MTERSLRGKVAIVGIGETAYYRHGRSPEPEFKLALMAILAAAEDAGIDPRDIDSFASYSNDRNDPSRLAAALGTRELRLSNMQWGGGGWDRVRRQCIDQPLRHLRTGAALRAEVHALHA